MACDVTGATGAGHEGRPEARCGRSTVAGVSACLSGGCCLDCVFLHTSGCVLVRWSVSTRNTVSYKHHFFHFSHHVLTPHTHSHPTPQCLAFLKSK